MDALELVASPLKNILCLGINHKTSDLSLRESLSLDETKRAILYRKIKEETSFKEALILSTCNRFELYLVFSDTLYQVSSLVQDVWALVLSVCEEFSLEEKQTLFSQTYSYSARDALRHIFRVVTSLDSLCLGETQVTGQFKKAYEEASSFKLSGFLLNRINREALTLNRRIRNRTLLGKKNKSISHLAIDLSLHIFKTLENKSFALIGAGKMISLAYSYALEHKPKSITILNRTKEKAEELLKPGTKSFSSGMDDLTKTLLESDIVLSSTASKSFVMTYEVLLEVQKKRDNRPLFIIDIALPRDVDPRCSSLENIYLFDLDDIRKVVSLKNKSYEEDILVAKSLIEERLVGFESWLSKVGSKDSLNHFGNYLNELFSREEERTLKKKNFKNISLEQRTEINRMLKSISQKILSDTALSMKIDENKEGEEIEIKIRKNLIKSRREAF